MKSNNNNSVLIKNITFSSDLKYTNFIIICQNSTLAVDNLKVESQFQNLFTVSFSQLKLKNSRFNTISNKQIKLKNN